MYTIPERTALCTSTCCCQATICAVIRKSGTCRKWWSTLLQRPVS